MFSVSQGSVWTGSLKTTSASISPRIIISRTLQAIGLRTASPNGPLTANWKILGAVVVVGACSLLAKLVATGKELAVAAWFGRSDALDAFLIALLLPTTVVSLLAGSFGGVLVPSFIRIQENQGQVAAQQFFSSIQTVGLVLLAGVSVLLAIAAPLYLPLLGSGFDAAKVLLAQKLLYVLLPFIVVNGAVLIWTSVLNAGETFALPALTPLLTPLVTLACLFIWGGKVGIFALAVGTIAGTILEATILGRTIRARGLELRLGWYGWTPELRLAGRQYLSVVTGSLILGVSPIIDQAMAAMLSAGSVAALSYGNKIVMVITTLTSSALGTAVLPYISQMMARNDWSGCRRTLKIYSLIVLSVTIPITVVLVAVSQPLVRLLYQRGAFTANDTLVVSAVQIGFALVIPFSTWCMLFVRYLTALHRNDVLAYGAVANACLNVVLNLVLMRRMGVAGIALSTSLVCVFSWAVTGFWVLKLLGREHAATVLVGH